MPTLDFQTERDIRVAQNVSKKESFLVLIGKKDESLKSLATKRALSTFLWMSDI